MKKFIKHLIALSIIIVVSLNLGLFVNAAELETIESNGIVLQKLPSQVDGKITLSGQTDKSLIKILIVKDEKQLWYDVKLNNGRFNEEIWFIDGKGTYQVSILIHKVERTYTFGLTVDVENTSDVNRFLVPTKHVESNDQEIVSLASEITEGANSDMDKAKKIYEWVVTNIKYDYGKYAKQLNKNFDNDYGAVNTLKTRTGVCYDYSTLVAALGRAAGMQVKVVKGNYKSSYREELHAWNEIYLSGEDRWINLDSTFGYSLGKDYFDNRDFYEDHIKIDEY